MQNNKKNLLENFLSLGALQIIGYVFPLFTLPYLSRVLSVEKFGLIYFAFAVMAYFDMLVDFGFGLSATREIAVNRHNQNNISNLFNSVTTIKIGLVFISYLILLISTIFVPKIHDNCLIFHLSFLMVVGNAIYPVWFFQGMERMKYITFLNILARLIFLILIFVFVKQQSDYIIVPLLNSLGFVASGILGFCFAVKKFGIKLYIPGFKTIKKQFKYSSEFFISRIAVSSYTNTNTVCLGFVGSELMVGFYVAGEKIYQAINGLKMPLTTSLYPFMSKSKDIKAYKKIFLCTIIITFFISLFAFIFAKDIITIFYGIKMQESYKIFRIFCFLFFINVPSVVVGYPLLGAYGHTKSCNYSVVASSIVHIIGLIILIALHKLTIYTMAYMVTFTTFIELCIRMFFVKKYKLLKSEDI